MRRFLALAFATSLALALGGGCVLDWSRGSGGGSGGSDLTPKACPAGQQSCEIGCSGGRCQVSCGASTSCHVDCFGGKCEVECGTATSCIVDCAGGGCSQSCGLSAGCTLNCAGGSCSQTCSTGCSCDGCG